MKIDASTARNDARNDGSVSEIEDFSDDAMNQQQIQQLKSDFAYQLLKNPNNPWKAANELPVDMAARSQIVQHWVMDPFVIQEKERLIDEHGVRHFLPSREDAARLAYEMALEFTKPADKEKMLRLFSDMMGYIEKPGVTVDNRSVTVNNVMAVPMASGEEEWEARAVAQQTELTNSLKNLEQKNAG